MEQERQAVVQRLGELGTSTFSKPTKSELHSAGIGIGRVHRREMKRYELDVGKQKVRLTKKLSEIDKYLQSVSDQEDYLKTNGAGDLPVVLPKPIVVLGIKPVFKTTRLSRMRRRGRY